MVSTLLLFRTALVPTSVRFQVLLFSVRLSVPSVRHPLLLRVLLAVQPMTLLLTALLGLGPCQRLWQLDTCRVMVAFVHLSLTLALCAFQPPPRVVYAVAAFLSLVSLRWAWISLIRSAASR